MPPLLQKLTPILFVVSAACVLKSVRQDAIPCASAQDVDLDVILVRRLVLFCFLRSSRFTICACRFLTKRASYALRILASFDVRV